MTEHNFCNPDDDLPYCKPHGTCDHKFYPNILHKRETYQWKPNDCDLLKWNASLFCSLLGDRKLLLIGDSTMQQSALTLTAMINYWYAENVKATNMWCANQVIFRLSDFLVASKTQFILGATHFHNNAEIERGKPFREYFREIAPDIVVFSSGAHLWELHVFHRMVEVLVQEVKSAVAERHEMVNSADHSPQYAGDEQKRNLSHRDHDVAFVWKTQNPGHPGRLSALGPELAMSVDDAMQHLALTHRADDEFHWNPLPSFDHSVKVLIKDSPIIYMDMSPLYLRPDGHHGSDRHYADCLHYCLPGPLDLFSVQLLHVLKHGGFHIS